MDVSARPSETTSAEDLLSQCRSLSTVKGRMHDVLALSQRRFREMITLAEFGGEIVLQINAMANVDAEERWIRSMTDTIKDDLKVVPSVDYFDAAVLGYDHDVQRISEETLEEMRGVLDGSASDTAATEFDRLAAVQQLVNRKMNQYMIASAKRRGARRKRPYSSTNNIKNEPGTSGTYVPSSSYGEWTKKTR